MLNEGLVKPPREESTFAAAATRPTPACRWRIVQQLRQLGEMSGDVTSLVLGHAVLRHVSPVLALEIDMGRTWRRELGNFLRPRRSGAVRSGEAARSFSLLPRCRYLAPPILHAFAHFVFDYFCCWRSRCSKLSAPMSMNALPD